MITKTAAGTWRVRVYVKGNEIGSKTFPTKTAAREYEANLLAKRGPIRSANPKKRRTKLADVVEEFLAEREGTISRKGWDVDRSNLRKHVSDAMKVTPIEDITAANLDAQYSALMKADLKRNTITRVRDSYVALFGWALRNGYVLENAALDSKVPKGVGKSSSKRKVMPFTRRELELLIENVRSRNENYGDMVEFVSLTGLRWGEVKSLRVGDIVPGEPTYLWVRRSQTDNYDESDPKSRRARMIPIVPRAAELFHRQAQCPGEDDRVFVSPMGKKMNGGNFKRSTHWKDIAGEHRFHDLRHTAATRWLRSGVDLHTVSAWLGHKTPAITLDHYSHYMGNASDVAALQRLATIELD
ncbi:MAG: tyrosine-type recombinase/integrase [Microcella sp.]